MDACTCVPVTEDFGRRIDNPCFCSMLWYEGSKQYRTLNIAGEIGELVPFEGLSISEECGIDENKTLKIEDLEFALSGVLHVQAVHDQSSDCDIGPDQNAVCSSDGGGIHGELKIIEPVPLNAITQIDLGNCATFPCSGEKQPSSPMPIDGSKGIPSTSLHSQSSSESDNLAHAKSTSLPETWKLVSALKGGREQQGLPPKTKLSVKWAPDVYDPPATSMSHTVKNHRHHYRRRPKPKKDHNKHKGRSSSKGSSTSQRKHTNLSSTGKIIDAPNLRLHPPGSRLLFDRFTQPNAEILEYAVSRQESKCGGSFMVGSLANGHFPITEAS